MSSMMDEDTSKKVSNLVIVTDATASMGQFLRSLRQSLLQFLSILQLTKKIDRIAILSYCDYEYKDVVKWSGWSRSFDELKKFVDALKPSGGYDTPEAVKTAAHFLFERISELLTKLEEVALTSDGGNNNPDAANTAANHLFSRVSELNKSVEKEDMITYVVWYADAPPHHHSNHRHSFRTSQGNITCNFEPELRALGEVRFDWVRTCRMLKDANIVVFPIIAACNVAEFYVMMSEITGGQTVNLHDTSSRIITAVTINLFLALMGCDYQFNSNQVFEKHFNRCLNMEMLKSETDCDGFLPHDKKLSGKNTHYMSSVVGKRPLVVRSRPELKTNLNKLAKLVNTDADYCNIVYDVFGRLLTPRDIESLTYNSIIGTLWRELCKRRNDERRNVLLALVNDTLQQVDERTHKVVSQWIEQSYNKLDNIREIIGACDTQVPAIVLETLTELTPKQMLELARSCNKSILETVLCLMTHIRVVDNPEHIKNKRYIPLALPERHIFELLPHLMADGTMFSLRPSIIMAMLAIITNNHILKGKANAFLMQKKGAWFDATVPENFTPGFARLVLRLPKQYLTVDELNLFQYLRNIHGMAVNEKSAVAIAIPYTPEKTQHFDEKVSCVICNEKRSKTLMTANNKCALCINDIDAAEKCDADHSYMVECGVCHGLYAVVRINLLKVKPKCHYCRMNERPPLRMCSSCHNHFVLPTFVAKSDADEPNDEFVCRQCEKQSDKAIEVHQVEIGILAYESDKNRSSILKLLGLKVSEKQDLFQRQSLFRLKDIFSQQQPLTNEASVIFKYKGKIARNTPEILSAILEWVQQGDPQKDSCVLCFSDIDKRQLDTVCGRKECDTRACSDCLNAWYGKSKPGHVVLPSSLTCPFCKRQPAVGVLRRYNRQLCTMVRVNYAALDPQWYHGWCIGCYKLRPFVEMTCAADIPELNGNFRCEECEQLERRTPNEPSPVTWKYCPNPSCEHPTEKTSGCNHITCPLCETHWCYECNQQFDAHFIYEHMYDEHGGIGV